MGFGGETIGNRIHRPIRKRKKKRVDYKPAQNYKMNFST